MYLPSRFRNFCGCAGSNHVEVCVFWKCGTSNNHFVHFPCQKCVLTHCELIMWFRRKKLISPLWNYHMCFNCLTSFLFLWGLSCCSVKILAIFASVAKSLLSECFNTSNLTNSVVNTVYNIAFVNSERWLAKSRVDITLCQHGKFPAALLLKFFVLYYKRNIKHFFRVDVQLYQHSWKLEKLEIVWKHSALRASCFHKISRFSNFHSCWYNCISTRKMFYIS